MPGLGTKIRPPATGLPVRWRARIDDYPIAAAWSPDGTRLAVLGSEGGLWILAGETGDIVRQRPAHRRGGTALGWSRDGATLATAGQDGVARLWDGQTADERAELPAGDAWVERLAWCPEDDLLATAAGKSLRLWSAGGELVAAFTDHPSTIADIAWRPRSREITAATYGGLTIRAAEPGAAATRHAWQGSTLVIAWSPDARYIATGDQDATVHFWITRTGDDLQMWGYPNKVRELAWHFSGRYLATGGGPSVVIWDCGGKGPERRKPLMLDSHEVPLTALAYQRAGSMLASACQGGRVVLWQPTQHRRPVGEVTLPDPVSQLAWSPDDRLLAAASVDGTILVLSPPR